MDLFNLGLKTIVGVRIMRPVGILLTFLLVFVLLPQVCTAQLEPAIPASIGLIPVVGGCPSGLCNAGTVLKGDSITLTAFGSLGMEEGNFGGPFCGPAALSIFDCL